MDIANILERSIQTSRTNVQQEIGFRMLNKQLDMMSGQHGDILKLLEGQPVNLATGYSIDGTGVHIDIKL